MARRSRNPNTRKKKKDPTVMVLVFAGVGFAFILIIVALLNSQSTTKKPKPTAKKNIKKASIAKETATQRKNTSTKKSKTKRTREHSPKAPKPTNPNASNQSKSVRAESDKSIEIPGNNSRFLPSDLNTLPTVLSLPEKPVGEHILTDKVRFTDTAQCDIKLHSAGQRAAKIKRTDSKNHHWTLAASNSDKPIADIRLSEEGIIFKWNKESDPAIRTLLHNSKLTLNSGRNKKTIQLRPIIKAPKIRLFGRDAEQQYSFDLQHAPDEIHWSLEPANPNAAPFNFPTVGLPTTEGPIPITEPLKWEPENNTGVVKARYVWKCASERGRRAQANRITITQTKEYRIGEADWKPLTTDSLKRDWDGRLKKYDNVVAGIKRKISKGKYPNGNQISALRKMLDEGNAFADVRSFYYALPEHTMKIDFRTPCDITDTLLAQYPANASTSGFGGMNRGGASTGAETGGKPMGGQSPRDSVQNRNSSLHNTRSSHPSDSDSNTESDTTQNDDTWELPPGQNPWKARQMNLNKITSGKR